MHEIQAHIATKKIKKSIENLGLLQDVDVHNDSHVILANGNLGRTFYCSFCTLGHMVMNCPSQ